MKLNNYFYIKRFIITATFIGVATILTHIPQETMPSQLQERGVDKILHFIAYGAMTFLLVISLKSMFSLRWALLVLLALSAIGVIDEITQSLVRRQTSSMDLLADVVGIVTVLLLSIACKPHLQNIKTGPASGLYFTAMISLIAGILVVPVASMSLTLLKGSLFQRQQAARYFFYTTMCKLFEDDFDLEEGSLSEEALETFKKHKTQLEDKCKFVINNYPYNQSRQRTGYFTGLAVFPSGDLFSVVIVQTQLGTALDGSTQ
jgi:VanZ family protein